MRDPDTVAHCGSVSCTVTDSRQYKLDGSADVSSTMLSLSWGEEQPDGIRVVSLCQV